MTTGAAEGWAPPDMTGAAESWAGRSFAWRDGERLCGSGAGRAARRSSCFAASASRRSSCSRRRERRRRCRRWPPPPKPSRTFHPVPVPEAAAATEDCLPDIAEAATLVAVGGGRVIDACKALAAAHGGSCAALPTTLSGAEMTAGAPAPARRARLSALAAAPRDRRPGAHGLAAGAGSHGQRHERLRARDGGALGPRGVAGHVAGRPGGRATHRRRADWCARRRRERRGRSRDGRPDRSLSAPSSPATPSAPRVWASTTRYARRSSVPPERRTPRPTP